MTVLVTAADLGTYLGETIDQTRADALIANAMILCQSIVNPLPDGSESVVLDVAARAYSNPTNVQQQSAIGFSASYGKVSGGMWLTRQNKAVLRRLAGGGGAFTIGTAPAGAGQGLPPWDRDGWEGWGGYDWWQTP